MGIYATNNPEACLYITDHSEASVVVVEDQKQLVRSALFTLDVQCLDFCATDCIIPYNVERSGGTISSFFLRSPPFSPRRTNRINLWKFAADCLGLKPL